MARLKEQWQAEWEVWQSRPLNDLEVVYLWVDGIYVKAGLEKEKAVLLVVLAALSDGSKAVVSVTSDLVAWIIPKDALSSCFSTPGIT